MSWIVCGSDRLIDLVMRRRTRWIRGTGELEPYMSLAFLWTCRSRRILRGLKEDCTGKNGNKDFWTEFQKLGRRMSLISSTDAKRVGGISDVSESDAEVVSVLFSLNTSVFVDGCGCG
jgi:hypothetical protein